MKHGHKAMTPEVRFFYDHAGWSHGPEESSEAGRLRCAESLARAEIEAERRGWFVDWGTDCDAEPCYETCERAGTEHTHEILCAVLCDADRHVLGSLGGIIDPDKTYGRVVAAELADEALTELAEALRRLHDAAMYLSKITGVPRHEETEQELVNARALLARLDAAGVTHGA